ncbi:hypothetical protein [Sporosarcina sp. Marseille-Q4943]|uniref:hypothetical protein n=1 Tax=Sporosarcina sp. Marseille-Q4943 TaxID=2942204 RepID=UPI00208DAB79|nr:hypothetical protein [Sporosarcina sp. Marseille-Q4943]
MDKNWKIELSHIPKVLESARINIRAWRRDKNLTNEIPQDIELDLLSVYVAEYIPIEHVDKLNKGLKKLVNKHRMQYEFGQIDRIDDFCINVKQSIHGGRWSNFGYIKFEEEKISQFVEKVNINGTHLSSSSIILQFIITPSKDFCSEFKKIVEGNIRENLTFNLTLKNLFKYWGGGRLAASITKNQLLEDYIVELKWRTMKEVSKYFDLFFTTTKLIPPSIEVYKLNQSACALKHKNDGKVNNFWRSVGMDSYFSDISKDGYWNLFMDDRSTHFIDNSLKVTCNSKIKKEPMFHSLDFQIVYLLQEFAESLLPIMVMREYANYTSKKVAIHQNKILSSLTKQNPKYKSLINIRYELEKNLQILKRFKNEIDENYFDRVKAEVKKITAFEPSKPKDLSATELIVDNTSYIVEKTNNHSQFFAKMIDDTVQLLEIKTNNSLRKSSFWLSVITVVLSIAATVFAGLSLFYQLSEENQNKVIRSLILILNLFR